MQQHLRNKSFELSKHPPLRRARKEMQNLNSSPGQEIDIGGHNVCVGSRVNVRRKGEWYDGQVLKLGPKRNLCRIKDVSSNQTLLLEPQQIKFTETHALDKRFLPGSHVAYNDGERWLEGVVETSSAVGILQVSWRKSVRAAEVQNWFEIVDVSPVVHDKAYLERNRDELAAGRSGLLHNDAVEPRPRTMENALFDPTEDDNDNNMVDHFSLLRSRKHNDSFTTSPTYEDIDEEVHKANRTKNRPLPSPPTLDQITDPWLSASPSFTPSHSMQPAQLPMAYPHISPYAAATWGLGEGSTVHHNSNPTFLIPHPKPAPDKNLEQSTLPCALSYQLNYHNGIPPHRSSNFFKRTIALPGHLTRDSQRSESDIFGHSMLKTSPSILSRAVTEPMSNFGTLPVIPRREKKRNRLFSAKKRQPKKATTAKKTNNAKNSEPQPYEVPTKPVEVITTEAESKEDDLSAMLAETGNVPRPQTSTPKKKPGSPVITSASPSLLSVNLGENILIMCTANGKSSLTYEWYKDGDKLPGKARNVEELSPGKLEVQKARQEDEGMYRCVVKNKHGSDNRYFRLNVTIQYRTPTKMVRRSPHRSRRNKKVDGSRKVDISQKVTKKPKEPSKTLLVTPPPEEEEEDQDVKRFLDNLIEDIQIPDVEFSIENGNGEDEVLEEEKEDRRGSEEVYPQTNPPEGQESLEHSSIEDGDELADMPEIAGAPDRKLKLPRRVSIGNKAVGEMDQYLGGYGEDYGSKSSTTDLEQEGLRYYKDREIKRSLAAREKEKHSSRDSSPTKTNDEDEQKMTTAFKGKSKKLLHFSKFARKKKKKTNEVADESHVVPQQHHNDTYIVTQPQDDDVARPLHDDVTQHHNDITPAPPSYNDIVRPHNDVAEKATAFTVPQILVEAPHVNGERDSIAVNTSMGGTDSEDTLVDEAAAEKIKGHVHLPLESLPVSDRVRLLQQSVREHHPDDFTTEASRKKGFFSGIFSKGKNNT